MMLLDRSNDVFRVGVRGQALMDFKETGRMKGQGEAAILREWKAWEATAAWETGSE